MSNQTVSTCGHLGALEQIYNQKGLQVSVGANSHPQGWQFDIYCCCDQDLQLVLEIAQQYSQDHDNLLIEVVNNNTTFGTQAAETII
jgi:hypothetical protein